MNSENPEICPELILSYVEAVVKSLEASAKVFTHDVCNRNISEEVSLSSNRSFMIWTQIDMTIRV